MSLETRLVAYLPGGARLGVLTDALTWTWSSTFNAISSLELSYSLYGRHVEWLQVPVEIAVEYINPATNNWLEFLSARFLMLEDDGDTLEPTGTVNYTGYGYAYLLQMTTLTMTPAQRNKTDGKRSFRTQSPGSVMSSVIVEAQARNCLSTMVFSFDGNYDSSGELWRHTQLGTAYDVGTPFFQMLKSLSDQNLCDWDFRGRELRIFNPNGELAAPRAATRYLTTTNSIDTLGFLDAVNSNVSGTPQAGVFPGGDAADGRVNQANILAIAQHGNPPIDAQGYTLATGQDTTWLNGTNNLAAWKRPDSPVDGIERALGAAICNVAAPAHWVLACPQQDGDRVDRCAGAIFKRSGSGIMLLSENSFSDRLDLNANSGYCRAGIGLVQKGLPVVEFYSYAASSFPSANIILSAGMWGAATDNALRGRMSTEINNRGTTVVVRNDIGALKIPANQRPTNLTQDSAIAKACRAYGVQYVRIAIGDNLTQNATLMNQVAEAVRNALVYVLQAGQSLRFTYPKGVGDITDPTTLGTVSLNFGRDITQAPAHGSLMNLAARVYAYGDSWSQTVVTNPAAVAPWGIWEVALANGGVNDTETLTKQAQTTLDQGTTKRISFTRQVDYTLARWLPGPDYGVGDYVLSQAQDGENVQMQILSMSITKGNDGVQVGSLTMGDRFFPFETKVAKAVLSASGGSVGGSHTAGAGVRTVNAIADTRKPLAPLGLN